MKQIISECKEYPQASGYYVHPTGRVFKVQEMTCHCNGNGYLYFKLNCAKVYKGAHRVVAETFIPNPNNLSQVDHIDGDKTNNNLDNLQWISPKDNTRKAFRKDNSVIVSPEGEEYVLTNVRMFAEEHNLDSSAISKLFKGKLKTHKGWSLKDNA